jgi:hypothetical protein
MQEYIFLEYPLVCHFTYMFIHLLVIFKTYGVLRFLDKTGRTGSNFQLLNGITLLVTFFGVRIVYGGKMVSFTLIWYHNAFTHYSAPFSPVL